MFKEIKILRKNRLLLGAVSALSLAATGQVAADTAKRQLYVESQKAGPALMELAAKTDSHIVIPKGIGDSTQLPALQGEYTLKAALDEILANTNLTYEFIADDSVMIKQSSADQGNDKRKKANSDNDRIEEMVVTATKRETRLQDTAAAISLLDNDTIEKRGLNSMGDYLNTIPGVTIQDRGAGQNSITMRGLSVTPQQERTAVGVYFGETAISGMASGPNVTSSDLRLVDVERVEVLKGPQGTLYGADSMGGIVRIIPAAPRLDELVGSVGGQLSNTGRLGGSNYQAQGVLNIPLLENQLALRAVVYRFENSGFIENIAGSYADASYPTIVYGQKFGAILEDRDDAGSDETTGFRLAARWQPTEALSVDFINAWQKIDQEGMRQVELTLPGKFQHLRVQPWPNLLDSEGNVLGPDGMAEEVQLTSLVLDYDLGWGSVHSASSWTDREGVLDEDFSYLGYGLPLGNSLNNKGERFSQELRFASRFEGRFQLLAGLYYEEWENRYLWGAHYTGDPAFASMANADSGFDFWAGHEDDPFYSYNDKTETVDQKAVFGELSYDITEQLTATVGVRHYSYEQTLYTLATGVLYTSETPIVRDDIAGDYSGENYKANLSWKPTEDTLVYAQWTEGFRLGRAVAPVLSSLGCDMDGNGAYELVAGGEVPIINGVMDPDTTENYELGFKSAFADNRVTLNAAFYHIDWEGLPARVSLACGSGYYANAGASTSEGIEVESRLSLTDALLLNLGVSYNEAKLSGDSSLGQDGDDLAGSADINFSAGMEYAFILAGFDAFARIDYAYVGEYQAIINQPDSVPLAGDYSQVHFKAGIAMNKLSLDIFVNNLTNADDLTWADQSGVLTPRPYGYRLRPRTVGLNLRYAF